MCEVQDVKAVFGFMRMKGIGVNRTNKELIAYSHYLERSEGLEAFLYSSLREDQRGVYKEMCRKEVSHCYAGEERFSMMLDATYPGTLRNMLKLNTPPVLTLLGNVDLLKNKKIGFSGSRKVSDKGLSITRDCVSQLATIPGVSIVSGYAQGVDREAHRSALECGGSTVIVLPNGMSDFSMRRELSDVWDWNRVLVISEYLPEDKWSVARAMGRNKTIVGLCDAIFVAEAGATGGSLDAGLRSLEAGKPLFVPCYGAFPESAVGNERLLKAGAFSVMRNRHTERANVEMLSRLLREG